MSASCIHHLVFLFAALKIFVASEDLDTLGRYGSIVYDVTVPLVELLRNNSNSHNNKSLEESDVYLSSYIFHRETYWHYSQIPINIAKYYHERMFDQLVYPEIDLIFKRNYTSLLPSFLSTTNVDHHPEAIVIKMRDLSKYGCDDYCTLAIPWLVLNSTEPADTSMKFGVAVDERAMTCLLGCSHVIPQLGLIVYNVDIYPITSISSYGNFANKMKQILIETESFVKDVTSHCEFYLRVSISEYRNDLAPQADTFRATIANFVKTWVKRETRANIIIDTFPISVPYPSLKDKLSNISPFLFEGEISIESHCELQRLLSDIGPKVKNIFLGFREYDHFVKMLPSCDYSNSNHSMTRSNANNYKLNLILRGVNDIESAASSIIDATNSLDLSEVYFSLETYSAGDLAKLLNLISPRNITVGCIERMGYYLDPDGFELTSRRLCDVYVNETSQPSLIMEFAIPISAQNQNYAQWFFDASVQYRDRFIRDHPKGKVLLLLTVFDYFGASYGGSQFRSNLYCSTHFRTAKDFYDAIATLATIYKFPLLAQPLLDSQEATGLWYNVITENDLNRTAARFPVLVRRNVPETAEETKDLPYTYPCIIRTDSVHSNVKLETNMFSGINLNISLVTKSTVTIEEIQALLLFAFGRFTSVEISNSDPVFGPILEALTKELSNALSPRKNEVEELNLYIEISDITTLEKYLWHLSGTSFIPSGFHLVGMEKQKLQIQKQVKQILQIYYRNYKTTKSIPFGVTVQNCTHEINVMLKRIRSLSYLPFIKYVICVVKPIDPTIFDKVVLQKFLDTHFYIQQCFKTFMKVETYFRLSFVPKQTTYLFTRTTNYLKFLNDTNQYAEGYKIKYFMGDGFTANDDKRWSWWRLSSNNDFTDATAYTELESEYFNRPTEQKYKLPPTVFQYIPLVIGLSSISVILLGAVFSIAFYHHRMKQRFLTRQEEDAFRYGEVVQQNEESEGVQYVHVHTTKTLGFDPKFEIARKCIQLLDEVGRGNFGVVYTALLNGKREVAVKFPHEDCTKEAFRSMLAEVKVLCYIGAHQNVLSFVGAYTKEIRSGHIWVVTEYCGNGSLETYLRKQRQQSKWSDLENAANCAGYVCGSDVVHEIGVNYAATDTAFLESNENEEPVDVRELQRFAYEIASGMEYISSKKVIHSDLASRNVLLTESMTCKIGDFGLSRKLYEDLEYIKNGKEGLPWRWLPVESLARLEFTSKSDVWSFGVTLWEIFSLGEIPYPGIEYRPDFCDMLEEGLRMAKPPHASEEIFGKMLECWNLSPDERPTFTGLSEFLKEFL